MECFSKKYRHFKIPSFTMSFLFF